MPSACSIRRLSHEGLSLWYGTADAPAPRDQERAGTSPILKMGVSPPSPSNVVTVRYRARGDLIKSIPAVPLSTDYQKLAQYFVAQFPALPAGKLVEYAPVLTCAGRSVGLAGDPHGAAPWSSFQIAAAPLPPTAAPPARPQLAFHLEYVTHLAAQLETPEAIGPVPAGLRLNYYVVGGQASGPHLNGKLRAHGADNMVVTPDGVGNVSVNSVVETNEGALVALQYSGVTDFGADGYPKALLGVIPARPAVQVALRFASAHPAYVWMNRLQFIGVGQVASAELKVSYDIYAVRAGAGAGSTAMTDGCDV